MPVQYSSEQVSALMGSRLAFNANQREMASRFRGINTDLIGNAYVLPKDVWESWDGETVQIYRDNLVLYDRLSSKVGRSVSLGKMIFYYGKSKSTPEVVKSLDGLAKARREQATIVYEGVPLPIYGSMFGYGWRQLQAAMEEGWDGLDETSRYDTSRVVAEEMESTVINGDSTIVFEGATQYGLRTAPGRNTRSTGADLSTATGAEVEAEFRATAAANHADNFKVPFTWYVNWDDWFYWSTTDYSTAKGDKTILQKLMEQPHVKEIVPVPDLAADELIALVEDRRVVEILNAMPITTIPMFRSNITDNYDFEVMAAFTLQFKRDADGKMGMAHST